MLQVKLTPHTFHFSKSFGITDGKQWFAYCYNDQEVAKKVLERLRAQSPDTLRHNINREEPSELVFSAKR